MLSFTNLINRIPGGVAQGIIWGIMALGVYITFRVLQESDMTVDGSFTSGGAVACILIVNGMNPLLALLFSFIAGLIAGAATGIIHTKLKIPAILAGILVQFSLYSINLHIMNMSSNISCNPDRYTLLLSLRNIPTAIVISFIFALILIILMYWYFGTEQGCAIRACGNNYRMALAQGINIDNMKVIGFSLGNGLVALSGGLMAQYQGFADINMGRAAIVIGLAAIIIGEVLSEIFFKKNTSFIVRLSFVIIGGIIYYLIMIIVLWLRVDSNDLKLFTALIVMIFMSVPNFRKGVK